VAFTDTEKATIRRYLGFSELFRDVDTRLEGQLDSLSAEAEALVRATLVQLAAIDAKIHTAALENLDLQRAEDVTFLGPEQLIALKDYGRSLINRIAVTFEVEPMRDYYGAGAMGGGVIPFG
jgi:hypothetical protein